MEEAYYALAKSLLDRKRVKRDKSFAQTMENAGLLCRASKLASKAYRTLAREQKNILFFKELTGIAISLLRKGKDEVALFAMLHIEI